MKENKPNETGCFIIFIAFFGSIFLLYVITAIYTIIMGDNIYKNVDGDDYSIADIIRHLFWILVVGGGITYFVDWKIKNPLK